MEHSILFVCAANVCRSPLMQFEFQRLVQDAGLAEQWRLGSAGVHVGKPHHICSTVMAMIDDKPLHEALAAHRSAPLTDEALEGFDLVITASLAERAIVARMLPATRTRTFTLREALLLSEKSMPHSESIAEVSAELNARRGQGMLPVVRSPRPFFRRAHPLDVSDDHSSSAIRHSATLASARKSVRTLEQRIVDSLAG